MAKMTHDPETNPDGAITVLASWEPESVEPEHFHPGDNLTVMIEGVMEMQFFVKAEDGTLTPEGDAVTLRVGESFHMVAGRIHSAKYITRCKLVYVHSGAYGLTKKRMASLRARRRCESRRSSWWMESRCVSVCVCVCRRAGSWS